ncbi:MAG: 1-deoxy-D-xylulose-5-phosphate synthase [Bacteroidales bacterium]|jgi:1-deoxy-D-xylulose-5-phosphate synthase|nr:1-deoxy-D-xylulose-5-phosphate synthase [Bacteroidales bacterium]
MSILDTIQYPSDIRKLPITDLPQLCAELREFIITQTAKNPGHLGASLGTVEITVAIHYVFDTPNDKLIWDVGHQAYTHKIITGRKEEFKSNRKYKGISGFPKMSESPYDSFGAGHTSVSISALLGMAVADRLNGKEDVSHVAVIGDGAMGGGMAFEALNHAGDTNENILIILNDNHIAIDESTGAMSKYLLEITTSDYYIKFKKKLWQILTLKKYRPNIITRSISALAQLIKGNISKDSNLFSHLGFDYFGPTDGHDIQLLVQILAKLKNIKGPKLFHIITTKGKGLLSAEQNQVKYHAPGLFDPETGAIFEKSNVPSPPKFQDVFGETLLELAQNDSKVVAITPAMLTGSSLTIMRDAIPERVFDVGIAEQHAVTFSAGLAVSGLIPFCNIYSSFLQRGYDQIVHDIALQKLPVVLCIDRAGIVGEDGPTHHGSFDLAYLRAIPNLIISSPKDEIELRNLMYTAYTQRELPFAIRYPRGSGSIIDWKQPMHKLEIGKSERLINGQKLAVLTLGPLTVHAIDAVNILKEEHIFPTLINMRYLKPLDTSIIDELMENHDTFITIEDGTENGGLFSAVAEYLSEKKSTKKLLHIAIPDHFVEHGDITNLYRDLGFDVQSIVRFIKETYDKN